MHVAHPGWAAYAAGSTVSAFRMHVVATFQVGIEVWRIEQFKVRPWSKSKFGRFHVGDSYIVLSTFLKDPENNDKVTCLLGLFT